MSDRECNKSVQPGKRIGAVSLGDCMDEVVRKLRDRPITWEERATQRVMYAPPYRIWFDKDSGIISQISVGKGFRGCFLSCIGIGSTLQEVKSVAGDYRDVDDAYHLDDYPGICFELEDIDDWDEATAPIEFITVFPCD